MEKRARASVLVIVAALLGPLISVAPASATAGVVRGAPDSAVAGTTRDAAAGATFTAGAQPRVVVVVGPTHGLTSSNLEAGERMAALAESRGASVQRVFHPNATWANVVAAAQGANVLIYLGHGNGFPSPYSSTLQPDRYDGMGLNPVAGGSSSSVRYYGEQYIATEIRLAPHALVLLNHLCYASGNSEPGREPPTESVAVQRVDNFAAGFLAAGAGAVVALGHQDAGDILDGLWSSPGTLDQLFMARGGIGTFEIRVDSTRTPGARLHLDPDSETDYYRSIAGALDLATADVLAGTASPGTPTPSPTPVPPSPAPTPTPAVPTPLPTPPGPGGTPVTGGPRLGVPDPVTAAFSPNGDGVKDSYAVSSRIDRVAAWTVRVERADGQAVVAWAGSGVVALASWGGQTATGIAPDGAYRVVIEAVDQSGVPGPAARASVVVDTVPPALASLVAGKVKPSAVAVFTPNGDGVSDTLALSFTASEPGTVSLVVRDAAGQPVRTLSASTDTGNGTATWDGRSDAGGYVPDGTYTITATPTDHAGNRGVGISIRVRVLTALRAVSTAPLVFDPRDGDALGATTTLAFMLSQPATITWRIADASDRTVRLFAQAQPSAAGPYALAWDGTGSSGGTGALGPLPEGRYLNTVTATTANGSVTIRSTIYLTAFRITPSATSRKAGQSLTVTVVSAEPLTGPPRLTVAQPGLPEYAVTTKLVSADTYKVTFTVRKGGRAGVMTLTVVGTDTGGGRQTASTTITVR